MTSKPFNLIYLLSSKLNAALYDPTLSAEHMHRVKEVFNILEPYKQFVSNLMQEKKHIFGNVTRNNSYVKNNKPHYDNESKAPWVSKNPKQENPKTEENWRTLKPDQNPNPNIFSRGFQKQVSDSGMEIKSRLNSQK